MPIDVMVEMVESGGSTLLPVVQDITAVEVFVDEPVAVEVGMPVPDTKYKIGGTSPVADPSILVWFDTLGQ